MSELESNKKEKKATPRKKNKKSKKDLLENAISEELENVEGIPQFIQSFEENKQEKEATAEKDLSAHKENESDSIMKEDKPVPQKNTPKAVDLDEVISDDVSRGTKKKVLAILALILVLGGFAAIAYFLWKPAVTSQIYLSTEKIDATSLPSLTGLESGFPKNKPIYIYFDSSANLGVKEIHIVITEILPAADGKVKETVVGSFEAEVDPTWRKFETYFQEEYFDHVGRYKIKIVSPEGTEIASREFRVSE
ncbi:MAG: hypothetical protein D6767_11110 [Candidatus Hydrogenedentota bacterium]|nr:MAG: hypothetical protein D6767_11110 [Candidatus Hydrogenedentota bacterium]